jgi:hypothetical protein
MGSRPFKPILSGSRPLLNLGGGDKTGLEKAFQALVGSPSPRVAPLPDPQLAQVLAILQSLGFQSNGPQQEPVRLTHPLAPDRFLPCQPPTGAATDPEIWALDWAARHFPEMEFYLPYISRRAARTKRPTGRPTTPEPEYDADGFLADYP